MMDASKRRCTHVGVIVLEVLRLALRAAGAGRGLHAVREGDDVARLVKDQVRPLSPLQHDHRTVCVRHLVTEGHRQRIGPRQAIHGDCT